MNDAEINTDLKAELATVRRRIRRMEIFIKGEAADWPDCGGLNGPAACCHYRDVERTYNKLLKRRKQLVFQTSPVKQRVEARHKLEDKALRLHLKEMDYATIAKRLGVNRYRAWKLVEQADMRKRKSKASKS